MMEENQQNVVPSTESEGIPQGAPAGVFVPNGQASVVLDTPVQIPVVQQPEQQASVVQQQLNVSEGAVPSVSSVQQSAQPGALENFFNGLVRFIAKVIGQPDPITGAPNTSDIAKKTDGIVGKMWDVANQVVEKASDAAGKATSVVVQATEKIQQVVPPPTSTVSQSAPVQQPVVTQTSTVTAPVEEKPAETPVTPQQSQQ